ncbi:hypothetical protein [Sandaracinus amylolyticus]|uniref:Kazal-type serine protease inhibitor domain protein n=1 Tax=Sandaracinus amylolyticus TaxID=927083 RepID=A0A0F6SI47_9BACT|nr:hypothetical protein [Sandaracinus amylolyticus]AKF11564.1 Kazal-type serine protease inhibitor domain protein [Sandaracinus amylolyticus]
MRASAFLFLALTAIGCGYRVRVGAHDGGPGSCATNADCALGNQCACGRCISLDVLPPSCDPPCEIAQPGDTCSAGRVCARGPCERLECRSGSFVRVVPPECTVDGGGWCECPAPPPGCYYDGEPCPCDHVTCPMGERCGRTVCGPGTVCCNASCGLCAPPDLSCTSEECMPDCSPMQAAGDGICGRALGLWIWDGRSCTELHGCSTCQGADCASAFSTRSECEATFAACVRRCGGIAGDACTASEFCDFPDPHACGGSDEIGTCRERPTVCPPVIHEVCGCDGQTYQSDCDAFGQGTDVDYEGPCVASCEAQDARGTGDCDAVLGWAWNGTACRSVSGCECVGPDCSSIWDEASDCERAHAHCVVPLMP